MTLPAPPSGSIGRELKLEDGAPKVRGVLEFGADLKRPGQLVARLVTSPHAHALLRGLDTDAAAALPGVHSVLTARDLPSITPSNRATLLLASDRVRFVGHPVALVLAQTEAAAQDAAELVIGDYEVLPAVVDLEQSLRADAHAVWPEGLPGDSAEAAAHGAAGGNDSASSAASPNVAGRMAFEQGDLEDAFAAADLVVDRTFHTASVHQGYLEPHVSLVEFDPLGEEVTVWTSTQAIFYVRDGVAEALGLDATRVRVVGTPVGGGFGAKFLLYEPLLALAARATGRPIFFAMTRLEEMTSATPAPATRVRVRMGANRNGDMVALDAEVVTDCGCFPSSMTILAGILLGSLYRIPSYRVVGIEVLTNRASTGAYRAPMAPQCAFGLESVIDELAHALELDPLEFRLRNAARPGDPMAIGRPWPSHGFTQVLEEIQRHPLWRDRKQSLARGRGVGLAVGGWPGGTEPAAAACSLQGDGTLQVQIGSVDITGTRTTMQQLAASVFGVEPEQVRIVSGDTRSGPFAGSSGGSKITYTVGPAVIQAAEDAKAQVLAMASHRLEAAIEDLEIRNGAVQVKGTPESAIALTSLARKTMAFGSTQAPIYGRGRHAQPDQAPGFCAQLAEVSVDEDTGQVTVHRLVLVQDVGRALNPLLVRGQMQGGAIQGLGWALYEELSYDDHGQPLTATLSDYALPHIHHLPLELEVEIVEVPSPFGPFGAKGVGEPPVIATAAAVANAIAEVSGRRMQRLPMTAPRILANAG